MASASPRYNTTWGRGAIAAPRRGLHGRPGEVRPHSPKVRSAAGAKSPRSLCLKTSRRARRGEAPVGVPQAGAPPRYLRAGGGGNPGSPVTPRRSTLAAQVAPKSHRTSVPPMEEEARPGPGEERPARPLVDPYLSGRPPGPAPAGCVPTAATPAARAPCPSSTAPVQHARRGRGGAGPSSDAAR